MFSKRLRTVAIVGAIAIVLVGIAGALGIPALARWGIETVGSRELGRALTVQQIRANPFTLRISARGLAMAEADASAAPFVSIDTAQIDLSAASLWRLAPVISAVKIDGLTVNVIRTAPQRFNFSDIVDRFAARPKTAGEPARFSVSNIELSRGTLTLDDRVLGARHALTDIALGVPFISSLPTHADIRVQPAFAARLDGTPVALHGETLPFGDPPESSLQLKLDGLALPTYLPFSPVRLNFDIPRGLLDTDLRIAFRAATAATAERPARAAEIVISGSAALRDFALVPAGSRAPIVTWQRLGVQVGRFAPLTGTLALDELTLDAPQVEVARSADGTLDWQRLAQAPVQRADAPASPPANPVTPASAGPPFTFSLSRLIVREGRLRYVDEPIDRFEQSLTGIAIDARGLSTVADPAAPPAQLSLAAAVAPQGRLTVEGTLALAPVAATLDVKLDDLALRAFARPLSQFVDGTLAGALDLGGRVAFALEGGEPRLTLREVTAAARELRLRGPQGSGAELDVGRAALGGGTLDLAARKLHADTLSVEAARALVTRLEDGRISWTRLARTSNAAVLDARDARARPAREPAAAPWAITLDALTLARSQLRFDDAGVSPAASVQLTGLAGTVRNVAADGSRRAEIALRSRVGRDGQLAVNGHARWDRLLADLRLDARALDLGAVRGYVAQQLNAVLVSGELSTRAALTLLQPADGPLRIRYDGGARLTNLHALDGGAGGEDLLRWQSLGVDRMVIALGEGPPQVDVGVVALEEFFARVILSEQGRLNLLDLARRPADGASRQASVTPASTSASTPAAAPTAAPADTAPAPRPRIRVDRVQLAGGNINFTDNFIRPNYTANLTDLTGSVTTLASDATDPATLTLAGRVNRDAPLSINGRLNPLAPKLFLDIEGVTKGVDLPQLTPYSAKYAGYPITKGKLSLDIRYRIADDKLEASNRLFLDQLTFGERVDSPTATRLPVLLAVALLKNSRGEIDINLPISGSLSDPQFSIGGVIVQVIVNLLTKAITAPFSLLAAAFGGGEELGQLDFAPGSAVLASEQVTRLEKLAKALNDRPALRLDITGRADGALDTAGLREQQFDARLRAAKIRQLVRAGGASVDPSQVAITSAERAALIDAAYADEPIADKPRVLGIARNIPSADKEKLLRAHLAQQALDLRALASARATAVRDWLETTGKVPRERLFVVEPKVVEAALPGKTAAAQVDPMTPLTAAAAPASAGDKPPAPGGARTGVDFSLK